MEAIQWSGGDMPGEEDWLDWSPWSVLRDEDKKHLLNTELLNSPAKWPSV